ncbi:MAG: hypothetical protein HYU66_20835 [Armatimonadetes bacterium]|nr:hypothetical protein [Armatimonadota bacterium]
MPDRDHAATQSPAVSLRAVAVALLLIPVQAYWIFNAEAVYAAIHATVLSIFFSAVCGLALVASANALIRRVRPRWALRPGELVVIYAMLAMATSMASHDLTQILVPLVAYPFRFATPENRWEELFNPEVPIRLSVRDPEVLKGFFEGHASLFTAANGGSWAGPMVAWGTLALLLLGTTLALNLLLRRAWCDEERLSFPCIHLPLQMTSTSSSLLRSSAFWIGFGIAGLLALLRGLNAVLPAVPTIPTKWELSAFVTDQPWRAIGWSPLCIYPFAIGLAYFMPQELAFSTWFFWLFWKAQMVLREWLGLGPLAGPYASDQSSGAWLALGLFALLGLRRPLREALRSPRPDEFVAPRWALAGFLLGCAGILAFLRGVGLSWPVAAAFEFVYLLIALAVTRMRAELGPPTHDLYFAGPDWLLTSLTGPLALGKRNLIGLTQLYWITRDYRSLAMPHQLEALKMLDLRGRTRRDGPRLPAALLLAGLVGFASTVLVELSQYYRHGASAGLHGYALGLASEAWRRLENWLTVAKPGPNRGELTQFVAGITLTVALMVLRRRFLGLPFHPVGYAIAGSWTMSWLWFSVLLSWLIKGFILRHGGLRRFRALMPFFLGLMLGDYLVGSAATIAGIFLAQKVPGFFT